MNSIEEQFIKWKDDVVDTKGNIPNSQNIIIRLFRYEPTYTGPAIIGLDGEDISSEQRAQLINICKVLAVGENSNYKQGDLCCLPDVYFQSEINPDYIQVRELLKERPAPEITDMPPKYILRLSKEMEKYIILLDKFSDTVTKEDKLTYCVPEAVIRNRYEYTGELKSSRSKGPSKSEKVEGVLSETTG